MSNCYSKNCYSCKHCQSGNYLLGTHEINEGNQVCILTNNEIVDRFGVEINTTPCEYYASNEPEYVPEINIEMQPLPF